jgi:two-component system phosphate regulon sensor histidine kinase PhoR
MNTKKYNWILRLISITIVVTIVVQLYWNYNNYLENKRQVQNEIQNSLDIAIDEYYSNVSKRNFFGFYSKDSTDVSKGAYFLQNLIPSKKDAAKKFSISSIEIKTDNPDEYRDMPKILDSILFQDSVLTKSMRRSRRLNNENLDEVPLQIIRGKRETDSLKLLKGIQTVVIALTNDGIDFTEMDSIFKNQLDKKGISTNHYLTLTVNDSLVGRSDYDTIDLTLYADGKSTYLRPNQDLRAYYKDPTIAALKKSSTGILLSLLLSGMVISSLFYMLKIIRKQKELAEIKNDLISNITHEFKTPIATVSTAIEAIENFNVLDDKEKTKKYLSMSSVQLKKLHQMVEKLLETATLDSEKLILKKEPVDVVDLASRISKKHELLTDKNISYSSNIDSKMIPIDLFHIENAISNLVDNAIKYGGENVVINVNSVLNTTEISVADDGKGIDKNQQERIFDKFYRVPKGNRHDVKGFGIGLYYSKKIVEKHGGTIGLQVSSGNTVFKINLPNE